VRAYRRCPDVHFPASEVMTEGAGGKAQHAERLRRHFRPDAIAWEHHDVYPH